MNADDSIIDALKASTIVADFERAFGEVVKLPVALRPVESWQLPFHGKKRENRFCALMGSRSRSCAACLQLQEKLADAARESPAVASCSYGLSEFAAPIRLDGSVIGLLQCGQVLRQPPAADQFERIASQVRACGIHLDERELRGAYFATPVVSPQKTDSIVALLAIFAEHLSIKATQIAAQRANFEMPQITRAKSYIREHILEELSLHDVARAVNMSSFYFCKMFTKYAGLHFTLFVRQLRTERARDLLLNKRLAVSEIAYAVGFQSLTHFNRVFKKLVGVSPTKFRRGLPKAG